RGGVIPAMHAALLGRRPQRAGLGLFEIGDGYRAWDPLAPPRLDDDRRIELGRADEVARSHPQPTVTILVHGVERVRGCRRGSDELGRAGPPRRVHAIAEREPT